MRRVLLTAIAIVAFISSAVLLHHAAARVRTPVDAKAADIGLLRLATNLCGPAGCVTVQTKRLNQHQLQNQNATPKTLQQYMQQRVPAHTAAASAS